MLTRLKELATQAASANSNQNLTDIDAEGEKLVQEIDRIANSTTFQGTSLLTGYGTHSSDAPMTTANAYDFNVENAIEGTYVVSGTADTQIKITHTDSGTSQTITVQQVDGENTFNFTQFGISFKTTAAFDTGNLTVLANDIDGMNITTNDSTFQVGETNDANYQISFQLDSATTTVLSVQAADVDMTSLSNAQGAMDKIDAAITALNTTRAKIGAIQNRLGYTYDNLAIAVENASAANSVIKDVDMAAEMVSFTKNQILMQAGTSMLAQANMAPQQVLSLFG
jgi:flagellin